MRISAAPNLTPTHGSEYEVLIDGVKLYGIYGSPGNRTLSWMTLIPPPGIHGREIAFRCAVPRGQRFRPLAIQRQFIFLDTVVSHRITFPGADLPAGIPIQLELFRGNEGVGAEPNSAIYRWIRRGDRSDGADDGPSFVCPVALAHRRGATGAIGRGCSPLPLPSLSSCEWRHHSPTTSNEAHGEGSAVSGG